jgi:antitoxin Phd
MPKGLKKSDRGIKLVNASIARPGLHDWQLQTAKAKFSEVFRLARTEGPQRITRQGKEGVVMISDEQYDRLMVKSHQPKSIVQFFRESPLVGVDLDLKRDRDTGRDIEL